MEHTPDIPVEIGWSRNGQDKLTIHWSPAQTMEVVKDFAALPTEEARDKYGLGKDVRDWKVSWAQDDLNQSGVDETLVAPVLYRPFDARSTYYTGKSRGFICMPRQEVMGHMLTGPNLGLITTRQCQQNWDALATSSIIGHKALATYDLNSLFPLYTYPTEQQEQIGQTREPNLSPAFVESVASCLGPCFHPRGFRRSQENRGSRDLFHSSTPSFTARSTAPGTRIFLKSDFARVTSDHQCQPVRRPCRSWTAPDILAFDGNSCWGITFLPGGRKQPGGTGSVHCSQGQHARTRSHKQATIPSKALILRPGN